MLNKFLWLGMFILATAVTGYGITVLLLPDIAAESFQERIHKGNLALFSHIICGSIALFIGAIQMSRRFRELSRTLHRNVGKVYLLAVSISAIAGMEMALQADGGIIARLGFGTLAVFWFVTGYLSYHTARNKKINEHRKWITYNYALTLAAVTLRILLGVGLGVLQIDFSTAYPVIAWLCWVPNMFVAKWLIGNQKKIGSSVSQETHDYQLT
ncbi:DUF2306 domain-containing protein [Vibrio genomosp. F10]|uniref:DUF2306 domain-containing protein n=1 Tax=Vibrio genomosp. F10 TaxID=723171 RepID=UPI000319AC5D|nr:DUF2306 domain-containing protein [Vibrio genomosp. F10]OEF03957.1 hypothetical protein A1QI_12420 [Vibrio genomosp. F10 str. 9ZB36]